MKVTFKNMIGGYTGSIDGVIFYWDPRLQRIIARSMPHVRITQRHIDFGAVTQNLMRINPSLGYQDDLRSYAERTYNLACFGGVRPCWNNLYMKLMHGLRRLYPGLNLQTLSKEDIYTADLPCISVKRAVEAGLLPVVRDYTALNQEI